MRTMFRRLCVFALLTIAACPNSSSDDEDGGTLDTGAGRDAGGARDTGVAMDSGARDMGVAMDSGARDTGVVEDTGVASDSGVPVDSGTAADAGSTDRGVLEDTGPASDSAVEDLGVIGDAGTSSDAGALDDAGTPDAGDPCAACSVHATCTSSTATCTCKPGFTGDGMSCVDVAGALAGLRWELPCTSGDLGNHVCNTIAPTTTSTTLAGASSELYDVVLRFRGVVEQKTYVGGMNDGAYFQIGGADDGGGFNVYRLSISDPAENYFLNRGASNIYNCFAIDYTATIRVRGGATVTLAADSFDGREIQNVDVNGVPIVVPDVPPAPAAIDGQFVQMDVLSVTAVIP